MRQFTELSTRPDEYTLTVEGAKTIVTFYTNIAECERVAQEGTEKYYTATAWTMTVPTQESLKNRVAAHTDLWLAKIKALTEVEEADAKLRELEKTATDDAVCELGEIVADLTDAVTELATMVAVLEV